MQIVNDSPGHKASNAKLSIQRGRFARIRVRCREYSLCLEEFQRLLIQIILLIGILGLVHLSTLREFGPILPGKAVMMEVAK